MSRYPHRYEPVEGATLGRCRCGAWSFTGDDCPATLRERVEELERGQASIHKATAAGRDAERAAVVAYLRQQAEKGGDPWMSYIADAIERGEHREGS